MHGRELRPLTDTESIGTVFDAYMRSGTHVPTPGDTSGLFNLLHRARRSTGNQTLKRRALGWLHYDMALSQHTTDPERAFQDYVQAEALLPNTERPGKSSQAQVLESAKNLALIGLLRSRLNPDEHEHHLNQQATIRQLGHVVTTGAEQAFIAREHDREAFPQILGALTEAAIAGALLISNEDDSHSFVPAPAAPRQDAPRREGEAARPVSSAIDYNLFDYGKNGGTYTVQPTQVKTTEFGVSSAAQRYDPNILMLYADRDLFAKQLSEFAALGDSLAGYSIGTEPATNLYIARSNLGLAYDYHVAVISEPEVAFPEVS